MKQRPDTVKVWPMHQPKAMTVAVASLALLVAGCGGGQSASSQAKDDVCAATSDINDHVDNLKQMTPATVTTAAVTNDLNAIKNDLSKIRDAQSTLSSDRKQQVQSATETFTDQVTATVESVGTSLSAADAAAQLQSALATLAASYQQSLGKIDCS